jgi:uncharacterized LabA/DUF88 family protein
MAFQPSSKIGIFIDGANLHVASKALGFDIDFRRLLREFQCLGSTLRAFYYTAISEEANCSSGPLVGWLNYNGYTVVTKAVKEFGDANGRRRIKGDMNVELAVDAMALAKQFDEFVLFSGDGDFRSLVEAVQRLGVRVSVVSTILTRPAMIADELRRHADEFIDLAALRHKLGRNPNVRLRADGKFENR